MERENNILLEVDLLDAHIQRMRTISDEEKLAKLKIMATRSIESIYEIRLNQIKEECVEKGVNEEL